MIAAVLHPSTMASSAAMHAFWDALPAEHRPPRADQLASHIARAWERARAAHPQLRVDETELMAFASGEHHASCPNDCCETDAAGGCRAECGNGFCEPGATAETCPAECT